MLWILGAEDSVSKLVITGFVSILGGGAFATMIGKWFDNKRDLYQSALTRISELEVRDRDCNERVTSLEKSRLELELAAARLRDHLSRVESNFTTAVITTDSSMKIIEWNDGATLIFGWFRHEVLLRDVEIIVPAHLKGKHQEACRAASDEYERVVDMDRPTTGLHRDQYEVPIQMKLVSFNNSVTGDKFYTAKITRLVLASDLRKSGHDLPIGGDLIDHTTGEHSGRGADNELEHNQGTSN